MLVCCGRKFLELETTGLSAPTESFFLTVQGCKLEVQRLAGTKAGKPEIVFLHEGLGSISGWREFPGQVVARTGCSGIVYSRCGYGNSEAVPSERQVQYMHQEALKALPELLDKADVKNPILLGHSDGASIAIIYAGTHDTGSRRPKAIILLAPHVFVEEVGLEGIAATKVLFETTDFAQKLSRHHRDAAASFWGWNRIWLKPEFRNWNIEEYLPRITCPVLAIQGVDDQYGTLAQLEAIERGVRGRFERVELENCRHSPHRDQPERTVEAIGKFVGEI